MNKADIISALQEKTDMTRTEATRAIDALFGVEDGIFATALRSGDKVQITGFGSFETKTREARKGRNPRTGKEIDIAASKSAAFRIGKRLKDALGA